MSADTLPSGRQLYDQGGYEELRYLTSPNSDGYDPDLEIDLSFREQLYLLGTLAGLVSPTAKVPKVPKVAGVADEVVDVQNKAPVTNDIYVRPNNATTKAQREAVQNKPCVDCGMKGQKNVADHKYELVKEHYETGTINLTRMRDVKSVQPQCKTCSSKQGAAMSKYSKQMKKIINERKKKP